MEDIIKLLVIENEAYFESLGERRGIALCTAASIGSESIVRHLLEWGADPDDQGGCHGTALHAAANRGFEDIVKLLLDNEADPNVQTRELGTVLQMAAAQGSEVIPSENPILRDRTRTSENGQVDVVRKVSL